MCPRAWNRKMIGKSRNRVSIFQKGAISSHKSLKRSFPGLCSKHSNASQEHPDLKLTFIEFSWHQALPFSGRFSAEEGK